MKTQFNYFKKILKLNNEDFNCSLREISQVTEVNFVNVFQTCLYDIDFDQCDCDEEDYCLCQNLPMKSTNVQFLAKADGDCLIRSLDAQTLLFKLCPDLEEVVNEVIWESVKAITGKSDAVIEDAVDTAVAHCNSNDITAFTCLLGSVQEKLRSGAVANPEILQDVVFKYRDLFK